MAFIGLNNKIGLTKAVTPPVVVELPPEIPEIPDDPPPSGDKHPVPSEG